MGEQPYEAPAIRDLGFDDLALLVGAMEQGIERQQVKRKSTWHPAARKDRVWRKNRG